MVIAYYSYLSKKLSEPQITEVALKRRRLKNLFVWESIIRRTLKKRLAVTTFFLDQQYDSLTGKYFIVYGILYT